MTRKFRATLTTALSLALGLAAAQGFAPGNAHADGLTEALTGGQMNADIRYRYENVDESTNPDKANASTLRSRLAYKTGDYQGLRLFVEFQNVMQIDGDHYDDGNGRGGTYPTVADPEGSEVNQAYVSYERMENLTVRVGNQRIQLDNDRHIGNVGWRQNEQTYEGALVSYRPMEALTVNYARLWNVNTVTGANIDATDSNVLNVNYWMEDIGSVSGYLYQIDTNGAGIASFQTMGLRFDGRIPLNEQLQVLATAEYATQSEYMSSGRDDAGYMALEAGAVYNGFFGKLGYESMEEADLTAVNPTGFITPLATNHAFNGWADQVSGGLNGLTDTWAALGHNSERIQAMLVYHTFGANASGAQDPGSELDLQVSYEVGDTYTVAAKYAAFTDDTLAANDVTKMWLMGTMKF